MPIYEYGCKKCKKKIDRFERIPQPRKRIKCESCGSMAPLVPSSFVASVFEPYWNDNIDPEKSVYIDSKKTEKEEFTKRGLVNKRW